MSELKDRMRHEEGQLQRTAEVPERRLGGTEAREHDRRVIVIGLALLLTVSLVAGVLLAVRWASGSTTDVLEGRIVFSRGGPNGGLYVMDADGAGLMQFTSVAGDDHAAWSPDGSQLAFNRYGNGRQDVYVLRADDSGLRRLTTDGASSSPAWSPEGARIAFARETAGHADLYVMSADGTQTTRLTRDPLLEYTPAWSPDGSKIALVAYSKGPPPSPTHLYVTNADVSGKRTIGPDNSALPSWSPDATTIAFVNEDDGSIYVINADGTGLRRVVELASLPGGDDFAPNFTSRPAWSPSGANILFAAGKATTSHLYMVNLDGSGLTQLTHGSVSDQGPAWSGGSS